MKDLVLSKSILIKAVMLITAFILISCESETTDDFKDLIAISITNNGNLKVIKENEKIRFFAEGTFKDGSTKVLDVTKLKWNTSDSSIAYISDDGLFTAIRQGVTAITATYKEITSNDMSIRVVSSDGLQSLKVSVSGGSSKFFVGETYQFKAIGTYGTGDEQDMTEAVIWHSSNENIATISNSFGSHGRLLVKSIGSVEIYCETIGINSNHIPILTEDVSVVSVKLTLDKLDVYLDERVKVSAIAKLSNGEEKNVIDELEWHYETVLVPNKTDDNYLYADQAGIYRFHVSYKGFNSDTVELSVNERVGEIESLELILTPTDNIYQNETFIIPEVVAHYSDHNEDITSLIEDWYLSPQTEAYIFNSNGLMFTEAGDFQLYVEYTPNNMDLLQSNTVNIHVNQLENGVKPQLNDLVINELLIAPPTDDILGDANNDGIRSGTDDEFIEIVNVTDKVLNLTNVYLSDLADNVIASFPDNTLIRPHQVIVIFGGGNPVGDFGGATVFTLNEGSLSLNNNGDVIFININEDNDNVIGNDTTIFVSLYDEWDWHYGSAVLSPELEQTELDWDYKKHCDPTNSGTTTCENYYSPGTRIDGSSFY
jgi:hypothetical protein